MHSFRFEPTELPPETAAVRAEVRAFLAENLADYPAAMRSRSWLGIDMDFSRKMGQAGFLGMIFPKQYGGHGKSAFERYVMLEEVLAAGAPVGGHWMTDRQSGPLILKFGTEEMKQRIIPRIAKGEIFELEAQELLGVCIQHEIDHLDGILFVDHLSKLKQRRLLEKTRKSQK